MRPTIAQQRETEVLRLAARKHESPNDEEIKEARSLMNSFYRLCGLCEYNLLLSNDARTADLKSTARSEEREARWAARLNKRLNDIYGLRLLWFGYLPTICEPDSTATAVQRFFYD